ncbi:hypothetical protein [uncultured Tenacibaculum sp.]|uniref:hypothetical protein n=1 Tax=uncultured Tenacibaculum sp. TaxID=174713 RepID=UPI00262B1AE7|nr:hypothetical protein [uncultured Tenacibaculum sp.]
MNNCLICNINLADKTGSHIIPHFLLKRIDNEEGSKKRDKEMGFLLSEFHPSSYFGRATKPETLEKVYGEVTEERIEQNEIPLVEDNIFCSACEKRLGEIESAYANTLKNGSEPNSNYQNLEDSFLAFIFWTSIVWRLSIAQKSGFKLNASDEEKLQIVLSQFLSIEIYDLDNLKKEGILENISYKILRSINYSDEKSTVLFCHPDIQNPYFFVIDEFILVFSIEKTKNQTGFESIDEQLNNAEMNTAFDGEMIRSVEPKIIDGIQEYFYSELSKRYLLNLSKEIDIIHRKLGGRGQIPMPIKEEIAKKIINDDDQPSGVKYTLKHKVKIIFEVLKKYGG